MDNTKSMTTRRAVYVKGSAPTRNLKEKSMKKNNAPDGPVSNDILGGEEANGATAIVTDSSDNPLTTRYDSIEAAGRFTHHRSGCFTGYVDVKDIRIAIPELDLLRELLDSDFNGAFKPGEMKQIITATSESDLRIIGYMQEWYKESFGKLRRYYEEVLMEWVPEYRAEKRVEDYFGTERDKVVLHHKVLEELEKTEEELDAVYEVLPTRGDKIQNAQRREQEFMREEMKTVFMINENYEKEVGDYTLNSIPQISIGASKLVEVAKHEIAAVLYMRIRAKMIDRFRMDPPALPVTQQLTFYHRLSESGEQKSIWEKRKSFETPAKKVPSKLAIKGDTKSVGKSVTGTSVRSKTTGSEKGVTNRSTTAKKSTTIQKERREKDSPGSLRKFIVNDNVSPSVEDVTNSDNRSATCDSSDEETALTDDSEYKSGKVYPAVRTIVKKPQRQAAAKGISKRQETEAKNNMHDLMLAKYMHFGGDMDSFYQLSPERLKAIEKAVFQDMELQKEMNTNPSSSVSSTTIRLMSGVARKETKPEVHMVNEIRPTAHSDWASPVLPDHLFKDYDDQSFARTIMSQLTTSTNASKARDKGFKSKKANSEEEEEELEEEDDDLEEDEEEEEEVSEDENEEDPYRLIGGGKEPSDPGDSSDNSDSKPTKKLPKPDKGKKSKGKKSSKAAAAVEVDDFFGDEYKKRFSTEGVKSRDRLLMVDGTISGDVPQEDKWRYKIIKKILGELINTASTFVKNDECGRMFTSLQRSVDGITLHSYKGSIKDISNLGTAPGRSVLKYLRDCTACEVLGTGVIHAVLNVEFPIAHYIGVYRQAVHKASEELDKLKKTSFEYGYRRVQTMNDIGREPTFGEVENEYKARFFEVEANLGSEYRRERDAAVREKKGGDYLILLQSAFDEAVSKTKKGLIAGIQAEFESRSEAYYAVKDKILKKQSQIQSIEGKTQQYQRVVSLLEHLVSFFQYVCTRLRASMGSSEVYAVVQSTLNKTMKSAVTSEFKYQPFSQSDLMGIWYNCNEYYGKANIANYFEFEERRLRLLGKSDIGHPEKQALLASLEIESEEMHYDMMPTELVDIGQLIYALPSERKKDVLEFLYKASPELRNKRPKEVGQYLAGLGLKEKVIQFLDDMHQHVYGNALHGKKKFGGYGYFGSEDADDGSEGEGYSGETKPKQKPSSKGQDQSKNKNGDSSAKGKPNHYVTVPANAGWERVKETNWYTTCKETLPLDKTTEWTPSRIIIYNCFDKKYENSTRFTSTTSPCEKCSKALGGGKGGHAPPCFLQQCGECHRYGHSKKFCLHQP